MSVPYGRRAHGHQFKPCPEKNRGIPSQLGIIENIIEALRLAVGEKIKGVYDSSARSLCPTSRATHSPMVYLPNAERALAMTTAVSSTPARRSLPSVKMDSHKSLHKDRINA